MRQFRSAFHLLFVAVMFVAGVFALAGCAGWDQPFRPAGAVVETEPLPTAAIAEASIAAKAVQASEAAAQATQAAATIASMVPGLSEAAGNIAKATEAFQEHQTARVANVEARLNDDDPSNDATNAEVFGIPLESLLVALGLMKGAHHVGRNGMRLTKSNGGGSSNGGGT